MLNFMLNEQPQHGLGMENDLGFKAPAKEGKVDSIVIDETFLAGDIDKADKLQKEALDELFFGKSLEEIAAAFKDPNSLAAQKLNYSLRLPEYAQATSEIDSEVKRVGMINKRVEELLKVFPMENDLRFMIKEAISRKMLEIGFGHLKNLKDIKTVLEQLKENSNADEPMKDSEGNELGYDVLNKYIALVDYFVVNEKAGLPIEEKFVNSFTQNYELRNTIKGCLTNIVPSVAS